MITVPVLCSREAVMQAMDFNAPARISQIDRAIAGAADDVHRLCHRFFFPQDGTRYFDWPNYQFTWPWKIYLDENELAAIPTSVITGTNQISPTNIPITSINFEPINYGPPYSWIELRRDLGSVFGANTTPQRDTSITGTFGFWTKTDSVGTLAANITSASQTSIQVANGSLYNGVNVGDMLLIGTERMIVSDKQPLATSDTLTGAGCTTQSLIDNQLLVASGPAYAVGEVLQIDQEQLFIQQILSNTLIVKRAANGTVLATHLDGATIYAYRQCTVTRGDLGTTAAASYSSGAALVKYRIPGSVNELAIAEALNTLQQETSGYLRKIGSLDTILQQEANDRGTRGKDIPIDGLNDLRRRTQRAYGRTMRQRTM